MAVNKAPAISIIVPVYNAAKHIRKCLEALLRQTFTDIEILCVDDGSTDESLQILQEFAAKDGRIRVFTQPNRGPATARNVGLSHAGGRYVMFCDADDWYEPNMCAVMEETLRKNDVDLGICDFFVHKEKGHGHKGNRDAYYVLKWTGKHYLTTQMKRGIRVSLWNKIFRMDLIRRYHISFPDGLNNEDNSFCYQYLSISHHAFALDTKLYNHVLAKDSIMGRFYNKKNQTALLDRALSMRYTISQLKRNGVLASNADYLIFRMESELYFIWPFLGWRDKFKAVRLYRELVASIPVPRLLTKILAATCKTPTWWAVYKVYLACIRRRKRKEILGNYRLKIEELVQQILSLRQRLLPPSEGEHNLTGRFIVLFDSLYDKNAEAIDAFSLFEQLRGKGVPCVYILMKENSLYRKLNLAYQPRQDIVAVDGVNDLFENHQELLARASHVVSSFGCRVNRNLVLHDLAYLEYIYIGHGVPLLKGKRDRVYTLDYYNKILAPASPSKAFLLDKGWPEKNIICADLPRWQKLKSDPQEEKTIFIFFTWRKGFQKDLDGRSFTKYKQCVFHFIKDERFAQWCAVHQIRVKIAMHHAMELYAGKTLQVPDWIDLVSMNQISQAIYQSDLLITDYSSVFADFARQDKPVLFYLFDRDVNYSQEADRDNISHAAGNISRILYNVCLTKQEVLDKLEYYRAHNFELEPANREKNRNFFWQPARPLAEVYPAFAAVPGRHPGGNK